MATRNQGPAQNVDTTSNDDLVDIESSADDGITSAEVKKVRVLTECIYGKANDIAELTEAEIKSAKESGIVDDHPDAVAYAESIKQPE